MGIHFKNVGQGDSIVIEWAYEGLLHIGIVDCCLDVEANNPVLRHLQALEGQPYVLQFIILSHPHRDHDSGILQLLAYLSAHQIVTQYFCHDYYFDARYNNPISKKKLTFLQQFRQLEKELDKAGLFVERTILATGYTIPMAGTGLQLRCLSPAGAELDLYQRQSQNTKPNGHWQSSARANLLSTVFKIEHSKKYCLFTADAAISTFERLHNNYQNAKRPSSIHIGQVPHHGSIKNYHEKFWHGIKRSTEAAAVISVGQNQYNHPAPMVLNSLQRVGYLVFCTNDWQSLAPVSAAAQVLSSVLDDVSTLISPTGQVSVSMPY